jgi:hypothetical protein
MKLKLSVSENQVETFHYVVPVPPKAIEPPNLVFVFRRQKFGGEEVLWVKF